MKKYFTLCLAMLMMNCFVSCSSGGTESSSENNSVADSESSAEPTEKETDEPETSEETTEEPTEEETDIPETSETEKPTEDKGISINSWELDKDDDGNDVLVVEYAWTNTDNEPASFTFSLIDKVFQNGIECEKSYGYDGTDIEMQSKDVQPGVTYNVKVAYILQDMTTANVVVDEIFSLDDETLLDEKIDLGGGEGTTINREDLQETSVKIIDYSLDVDYSGEEVLLVNYEFYNGEDSTESFATTFTDKAFQNGVECDNMVIMDFDSDVDLGKSMTNIQPGASCIITQAYKLTDKSDVEISVTGWLSDTEYLKETIKLQ